MVKRVEKFDLVERLAVYGDDVSVAFDSLNVLGSGKTFDNYIRKLVGEPKIDTFLSMQEECRAKLAGGPVRDYFKREISVSRHGNEAVLQVKVPGYFPSDLARDEVKSEIVNEFGRVINQYTSEGENRNYILSFALPLVD